MVNRSASVAVCLCVLASAAAIAQPTAAGTGLVFELPGNNSVSGAFQGYLYNANPLTPINPAAGPTAATQIIAKPDGTGYYFLSSGGLQFSNSSFSSFAAVNGITGVACTAALTPNGRYLFVGAATACTATGASALYILDTSNNNVLGNTVSVTGAILGFAITPDSATAYMLTNTGLTAAVTGIDVASRAQTASAQLPFSGAVSISISPQGLLYVAEGNVVEELIPNATNTAQCSGTVFNNAPPLCITPQGIFQGIEGVPGPLHFTPSGNVIYVVNTTPGPGGHSLYQINLLNRASPIAAWPPFGTPNPPTFTDVYVAGENEVFALSPDNGEVWDVNTTTLSAQATSKLGGALPGSGVLALTLSNEVPSSRFLFALVTQPGNHVNLERVDLTSNLVTSNVATTLNPGILQFVTVPPTSGAAQFYVYNNNQQVAAGATSLPLSALVLDGTGRPIFNQPVTYAPADPTTGITINNPTAASNVNGFVTATATMPAKAPSGPYTVTLTAGTAVQSFTLTVPGTNGGGGNPQVTIVGGQGMLLEAFFLVPQPLTVLVTDSNGKPLSGVAVTFSPVIGCGNPLLGTAEASSVPVTTDENGLASSPLVAFPPTNGQSFEVTDINASTSVGSVDFCETSFVVSQDGISRIPTVNPITPANGSIINIGEGDTLPNAITAVFTSQAIPDIGVPIPNVAISIASTTNPPPATCSGNTLSDATGLARCTLVASCHEGSGPITVLFGSFGTFSYVLNVGPGSGRKIAYSSGDKQNGTTGSTLAVPLVATVTDNCGQTITGLQVTWKIIQGSATLASTISMSDSSGNVSTLVKFGQVPGPVQVSVTLGSGTPVVFNLNSTAVVSALTLVSGGGQSATVSQPFAQPLVFALTDAQGNPIPHILITFGVTSGIASVNPPTATTDSTTGQVSVQVTAGATSGPVTITASYTTFSAVANLTVKPVGPSITAASFYDAATVGSLNPRGGIVPCGLGSLVGQGIALNVQGIISGNTLGIGPLAYTLAGFSMTIDGVDVPLLSISNQNGNQQVNFQTPCETSTASAATAVITINGNTTTITGIPVQTALPGIFTYAGPNNQALGFVISAADGSYVTPSNPAKTGTSYYLVLTGLGQGTPPIITNAAGTGSQTIPLSNVIVGLDNAGVPVTLAEYAAGQIGVYVIGFQIPKNAPTGPNQPLTVAILVNGNYVFANAVYLPQVVAGP